MTTRVHGIPLSPLRHREAESSTGWMDFMCRAVEEEHPLQAVQGALYNVAAWSKTMVNKGANSGEVQKCHGGWGYLPRQVRRPRRKEGQHQGTSWLPRQRGPLGPGDTGMHRVETPPGTASASLSFFVLTTTNLEPPDTGVLVPFRNIANHKGTNNCNNNNHTSEDMLYGLGPNIEWCNGIHTSRGKK